MCEWTIPVPCSPYCNSREQNNACGGFWLSKAECCPNEERDTEELNRIRHGAPMEEPSEDNAADREDGNNEAESLDDLSQSPFYMWMAVPDDEEWSDDDVTDCIPQPPRYPNVRKIFPCGKSCERKAEHSDRGTDHGAEECGIERKL